MSSLLISILCGLGFGLLPVVAADAGGMDAANRQFQASDFAGAVVAYERVLAEEGPRAAVFYNLGNCYQRLGDNGHAILAYERARLLTPRDPDLLANLALARKAAAAFEESGREPWVEGVIHYLSRNEWSWLVAGSALALGGLAVVAGLAGLPRRGLRQWPVAVSVLAGLGVGLGCGVLYLRRGEARLGVVLSSAATVRLSPFEQAESLGTPGPGRIVRMGSKSGAFYYIEVPGGALHGWLASQDVAAITPDQ